MNLEHAFVEHFGTAVQRECLGLLLAQLPCAHGINVAVEACSRLVGNCES